MTQTPDLGQFESSHRRIRIIHGGCSYLFSLNFHQLSLNALREKLSEHHYHRQKFDEDLVLAIAFGAIHRLT
jgi:hypothetical protein